MGGVEQIWQAWEDEPLHDAVEQEARRLGLELWITGGAVRDALLGLPVTDWDLAVPNARRLTEALARQLGVRPVLLHEDIPTCRLVIPAGDRVVQLDVVQYRADTIERDLAARDFTINALAAAPLARRWRDPLGGLADLRRGTIRTPSEDNLRADSLRCLRAYRFHSQFGFTIEPQTRRWLRATVRQLPQVAGERVGEEFLKLLTPPRAAETLHLMDGDGALGQIIPEIEPTRGVEQGRYHHLDVWGHTLAVVARLEEILLSPEQYFPLSLEAVRLYLQQPRMPAVLLLTALLHDLGKPPCRKQDERGWWRFFDHDLQGARMAGHIARRLALRRDYTAALRLLIGGHMRPLQLANLRLPQDGRPPQEITTSALRRLFRDTHPDGIGLLLLGLADARGCCGPATRLGYHDELAVVLDAMLAQFVQYRSLRAQKRILTGDDLIAAGHAPGEAFGTVLEAVEDAWADGVVQNRTEALALAEELLRKATPQAGEPCPQGETL